MWSKDIEASGFNGTAAFMEVRVQSIVVEFILTHVDQLFGGAALSKGDTESKSGWRSLPGARASGSPEDLMPRSLPYNLPSILQAGDGPPQIRPYHTIIEIAEHKRKGSLKVRKWKSIFNLGRSGHEAKRKLPRGAEDREDKSDKGTLRPAKSMDSLSAAAGVSDGEYRCARGVCAGLDPCVPGTAFLSTDEKLEASSAAGPPADCGPADVAPALEDCLSQEVQDSFSFLEDSSSSEPEWVGVEDGEVAEAGTAGTAFSPGEDDPGMGYPEELLRVGPQVEEFSVEPPLDDLSLDEAQFVLAPSCRSPDSAGPGPEGEEESGEEVFLSAYDDLSPLLGPRHPNWEGPGSLEEEAAGCRGRGPPGQAEGEQACREGGEDREAEPEGRRDVPEEAEGSLESEVEDGEAGEGGGRAGERQGTTVSVKEGGGEEPEAKEEESRGEQEEGSTEEAKCAVGTGGGQGKDEEKERKERGEEAEGGEEAQVQAGRDPECGAQETQVAEGSWAAVHRREADGGREDEAKGQQGPEDQGAREAQGGGEDGRGPEAAAGGRAGKVSEGRESGDGEREGDQSAGGDRVEKDALPEGSHAEPLEVGSAEEGNPQSSEAEQAVPQPPRPQEMEPGGPLGPEGCNPCPCPLGSAGGVGMRLASSLVQVQQVRSVPVVPPKPQFAKMPSAMCSKIHVAPANPCPRPGRLDGTPGERAWGSRASRSSWRNGGSLSFDAAVALARDRQRTEAQGIRRTQTCTGGGDYSLIPRTSPCSVIPAYSRPLSCLGLPPEEDTEGSGHRSRLSLPPREPQPPDPLLSPQRRSYAFETQANPGRGEGL
uniref:Rho GTPase activating protein 30 n=1 Tax=Panthera tigris altaica TaxID=74533 RepID=A0A8C9KS89_PANTA